jgi:ribosomal protein S18 acetylase RimI-like enzyme
MHRADITKDGIRTIRAGTNADTPALGRLPHTATALHAIEASLPGGSDILRQVIKNGEIIGVGCGGRQLDENLPLRGYDGEITLIYVLPECQHQGIGSDLMGFVARQLTAGEISGATAWAPRDNAVACLFYIHRWRASRGGTPSGPSVTG